MLVFPMAVAQTPKVGQTPRVGMTALIPTNFWFPDLDLWVIFEIVVWCGRGLMNTED